MHAKIVHCPYFIVFYFSTVYVGLIGTVRLKFTKQLNTSDVSYLIELVHQLKPQKNNKLEKSFCAR